MELTSLPLEEWKLVMLAECDKMLVGLEAHSQKLQRERELHGWEEPPVMRTGGVTKEVVQANMRIGLRKKGLAICAMEKARGKFGPKLERLDLKWHNAKSLLSRQAFEHTLMNELLAGDAEQKATMKKMKGMLTYITTRVKKCKARLIAKGKLLRILVADLERERAAEAKLRMDIINLDL